MICGIAHVCLVTCDLNAMISFYCDRLGLTAGFDYYDESGNRYGKYIYVGRRTFLELFLAEQIERSEHAPCRHLCLEVDDMDTTVADLRSAGIDVTDPQRGKDRSWQAWLCDPDGNRIELHAYTDQSKQGEYL